MTIHGYKREKKFTNQVGDRVVEAAVAASKRLVPVTMSFRLGQESTVGGNSRLALANGMIYRVGPLDEVVRPTPPTPICPSGRSAAGTGPSKP